MYSLALIIFVVSEKKAFEHFPIGSNVNRPYGKNVSKCFFSETTWTVETKLPRNDHCKVLYKFSVFYAERKSKMAATAGHRTGTKNLKFVEGYLMNIHVQFGFNHICSFSEEGI
jgi:hypothetical protein